MSKNKQNTGVPSKEVYGRMNFLYQASMLMAKQNNSTLSAFYGRQCQSIGKKALLRISPDIKRNFCKRCALAQQPGTTTDLEIVPQKRKLNRTKKEAANFEDKNIDHGADVFMKCRKCSYKRKFIVNPNYNFYLENPAAVETLKINSIQKTQQSDEANKSKITTKDDTTLPKEQKAS